MGEHKVRSWRKGVCLLGFLGLLLGVASAGSGQVIENVDGVRVVHNVSGGKWGGNPKVKLELVRKIGDIDTEDENVAFNHPSDVAVDKEGNVYVLDTGNARIQKFGPDGKYLSTIGGKGQGPGEFMLPDGIDFDRNGNLVVADSAQSRIKLVIDGGRDVKSVVLRDQSIRGIRSLRSGNYVVSTAVFLGRTTKGEWQKPNEARLFKILSPDGSIMYEFGKLTDFGEPLTNVVGNASALDVDARDAIYVSFIFQNRVEKYGPDGTLVWRVDRPLNYSTEVIKKGWIGQFGGNSPEMNTCATGIAADAEGRIWVVTLNRQLTKEVEGVKTSGLTIKDKGSQSISFASIKTEANSDVSRSDAFKLEIFAADGVLLGELPLTHFADVIRIAGDNLFLIDRDHRITVYQYRIVEQ
jgi:hypothetical protein